MAYKRKNKTTRSLIHKPTQPAPTFSLFNKLPVEIRCTIWQLAAKEFPFLHLAVRDTEEQHQEHPPFSAKINLFSGLALACKESRHELFRNYEKSTVEAGIPLNFTRDCVLLDHYEGPARFHTNTNDGAALSYLHPQCQRRRNWNSVVDFCDYMALNKFSLDSVRHLAMVEGKSWVCNRAILKMRNLETVTLVFDFAELVLENKALSRAGVKEEGFRLGRISGLKEVDRSFKGWKSGVMRREVASFMEAYFRELAEEVEGWEAPEVRIVEYVREEVVRK